MQKKNFILFIVLCIVILVGWGQFQAVMWPPKPKKGPDAKGKPPDQALPASKDPKHEAVAHLFSVRPTADLGLANVARLVIGSEAIARLVGPLIPESPLRYYPRETGGFVGSPTLGGYAALAYRVSLGPVLPRPDLVAKFQDDIPLSEEGYYLQVILTNKGAAVRGLTLPKFQAASDLGLPVYQKDSKGQQVAAPLQLIPDDPIRPSFRMFHYPNSKAEDPDHPIPEKRSIPSTLLGEVPWTIEAQRINDRKQREVVMSFDRIPGFEGVKVIKTFTLGAKDYHIGLEIEIRDDRPTEQQKKAPFRYQLAGAHGLPVEGEWYASVYRQPMIGMLQGGKNLWRDLDETQQRVVHRQGGEKIPLQRGDNIIQYAGVANQYFASLIVLDDQQVPAARGGEPMGNILEYARTTLESEEVAGVVDTMAPDKLVLAQVLGNVALEKHFELLEQARRDLKERAIQPKAAVLVNYYRKPNGTFVATGVRPGRVLRPMFDDITVRVVSVPIKERPLTIHKFLLYNGPAKVSLLGQFTGDKAVDPELVERYWDTLHLRTLTDYRSPGPFGAFAQAIHWTDLLILTTRLMHWLLDKLHWVIPNYGLAIILLTLIVRVLMFPISRRQAMLSIRMQELAPEIRKVQEKYKTDPKGRNQAVMELYRKHGVNPLGGCLTLLMQLPIFMGLYYCLQESVHFRLAGFLWIDNLAAPDMMIWWSESIPLISDPDSMGMGFLCFPTNPFYLGPYFNLLPIVAVSLMLVQQKMLTPPPADEQQAFQQKLMKWMMVFFGIMFYKVAAGLCIYFIVSSLWGVAERKLLPKKPTPGGAPPPGGGGGGGGPGRGPGPSGKGKGRGKKEKQPEGKMSKVRNWWQDVLKQAKKK